MLSISNAPDVDGRILAAAASCVLDFGIDRVTLVAASRDATHRRSLIA